MGSEKIDPTEILSQRPLLMERFEVIQILGEGAAGAVYHVRDKQDKDREVALKVLVNQTAFDEHTRRRFKEEWLISSKLMHKNIVTAYELIELDDAIAYTMEYVKGRELSEVLGVANKDFQWVDKIFSQLLEALEFLHQNGVFHRDIKLENILVDKNANLKLSDLGLMKINRQDKLTKTGVLLGTAQYMPPEYIRSSQYGVQSEVYAVGVVLYEVLSGKRWMGELSGNEAIERLIRTNFTFPQLSKTSTPQKYQYILKRSLHPLPEQRFQDVQTMRRAFDRDLKFFELNHQNQEFELAFTPAELPVEAAPVRKFHPGWLQASATVAVCMILVTLGTGLFHLGYFNPPIVPPEGAYTADFIDPGGRNSEKFSVQLGKAGGFFLSEHFCVRGLLDFSKNKLICGDESYRTVVQQNGASYSVRVYRSFHMEGEILLEKAGTR